MFGFFEKNWDAAEIPDLTGRVAIVTGGNTGLGLVTVQELARHGAQVYMLSRTEARATKAINEIKTEIPNAKVDYINFDLLNLKSGKVAASEFLQREQRLDILVNNAGIMATPYELSPDGIEIQACNGTGHFALTVPLLPILKQTAAKLDSHVRIVNVTSGGYRFARNPDFSTLEGMNQEGWSTWVRYGNSKLSNILFTNELQKRLDGTGIHCLAVHPGPVATELTRGPLQSWPLLSPLVPVARLFLYSPYQGALTQLYAAASPEVETKGLKAALLFPIAKVTTKDVQAEDKNGKLGSDFWNLCEKLVAEKS